jgi:uncharacterized protein YndB with AHSA1/START domain
MSKSIKHTIQYSQKLEAVWEFLTKADLIAQWLMQNDFKPIVGHEFQFRHSPMPNYGFDGFVYCKVLEIIPLKKFRIPGKADRVKVR